MSPPAVRGFPERLRGIWGGAAAAAARTRKSFLLVFSFLTVTGTPKPAQIFDTDFLLQGHHDWVGSGHPQLMQGFGKKCRGLVTVESSNTINCLKNVGLCNFSTNSKHTK